MSWVTLDGALGMGFVDRLLASFSRSRNFCMLLCRSIRPLGHVRELSA